MSRFKLLSAVTIVAVVLSLAAFPIGANAATLLPNGFTAAVVATSGETITGNINASGSDVGIYIGPGVHDVTVRGAKVTGANDEGILVQDASYIVIEDSTVSGNAINAVAGLSEVKGIGLAGATNCLVKDNTVEDNMHGGIGVYDDGPNSPFAPTSIDITPVAGTGNVITGNTVLNNPNDCGIVVSAKNPGAGVNDNTISNNRVIGRIGGIIVAGGAFGPVNVTNNVIQNNLVTGSLIPGISIHAFGPGFISGTKLIGNVLSNNGVGDLSGKTTGIEIFAVPHVGVITGTQVQSDTAM